MNKKFTFMVAALLAAGSISANAEVTAETTLEEGVAYYVVYDAATDGLSADDVALNANAKINTKMKAVDEDAFKALSTSSQWFFVKEGDNGFKLKNVATGEFLSVESGSKKYDVFAFDSNKNIVAKDCPEANRYLELVGETGPSTPSKGGETNLDAAKSAGLGDFFFIKAFDSQVSVETLAKQGKGVSFSFEGSPKNADVFKNVTVVKVASTASNEFFLMKGSSVEAGTEMTFGSDDFKKAEFVVLTATTHATGVTAPVGYEYAVVKGDKLIETIDGDLDTDDVVEAGEYPEAHAIFKAYANTNDGGKLYLIQENTLTIVDDAANNTKKWSDDATLRNVYVGITGTSDKYITAQTEDNKSLIGYNEGTAVVVKDLVKGQWIVNILTSSSQNSTEMKRVLYATEASSSVATLTEPDDDVNAIKEGLNAQWIVSADKSGNSVTFKNRITGKEITNVTLYKTPIEGIYSASCEDTQVGDDLKSCYIQLRTVENTTQFDGFLKLEADDLKSTEYTLSVTNELNAFEKEEKGLVAINGAIKNEDKDNKDLLTFKLDQSKSKVDDADKLDTLFVKEVVFNYYKDGKLTEAKDTLKAIKYNFVDLKNAGKSGSDAYVEVTDGFALRTSGGSGTEGKFVFRKTGEQYQIMKSAANNDFGYTQTNYVVYHTNAYVTGQNTAAQLFNLNPVAVAPNYEMPENHVALEINGAYLGVKADGNAVMTNDTSLLKSTNVGSSFAFWAFSADKETAKTPSYYLSSNGKMMYDAKAEVEAIDKELATLSPVFDAEKIAELKEKKATYFKDGDSTKDRLVKFQQAKYVDAEHIALANDTVEGDALKAYKFNIFDVDGQAVLKNGNGLYVKVLNEAVVLGSAEDAAKFDVVAAEAPTSNESVSASEVKVIANNGSIVVKNAAGKNVVVSTILGQVVANEVLTSDNATINVPAGIVVVAVEGESFKVNVK